MRSWHLPWVGAGFGGTRWLCCSSSPPRLSTLFVTLWGHWHKAAEPSLCRRLPALLQELLEEEAQLLGCRW